MKEPINDNLLTALKEIWDHYEELPVRDVNASLEDIGRTVYASDVGDIQDIAEKVLKRLGFEDFPPRSPQKNQPWIISQQKEAPMQTCHITTPDIPKDSTIITRVIFDEEEEDVESFVGGFALFWDHWHLRIITLGSGETYCYRLKDVKKMVRLYAENYTSDTKDEDMTAFEEFIFHV